MNYILRFQRLYGNSVVANDPYRVEEQFLFLKVDTSRLSLKLSLNLEVFWQNARIPFVLGGGITHKLKVFVIFEKTVEIFNSVKPRDFNRPYLCLFITDFNKRNHLNKISIFFFCKQFETDNHKWRDVGLKIKSISY